MRNVSYERYLELRHAYPREHQYGHGEAPAPMTRAKWEDYGIGMRTVEINVLEHQNRGLAERARRGEQDVPATDAELVW